MGTENQQAHNNGVMKSPGNPVESGRAKLDCWRREEQDARVSLLHAVL